MPDSIIEKKKVEGPLEQRRRGPSQHRSECLTIGNESGNQQTRLALTSRSDAPALVQICSSASQLRLRLSSLRPSLSALSSHSVSVMCLMPGGHSTPQHCEPRGREG